MRLLDRTQKGAQNLVEGLALLAVRPETSRPTLPVCLVSAALTTCAPFGQGDADGLGGRYCAARGVGPPP
jgi:hypothetical protein